MRRGFDLDVLACPRCGGRMRLLATIEAPQVLRTILAHLGLATEVPVLSPPRSPLARAADLIADLPAGPRSSAPATLRCHTHARGPSTWKPGPSFAGFRPPSSSTFSS